MRAGLLVVVAALVVWPTTTAPLATPSSWAGPVLLLAVPVLALDAVDGAVARRTVTTTRGARLDMETDAAAVLVLAVAAAPFVGAWVLTAGLLRYAFGLAGALRPALRAPLPYSLARRVVAAVQGPALLVPVAALLVPGVPPVAGVLACAAALTALVWSFGRDVVRLEREGRRGTSRIATVRARS